MTRDFLWNTTLTEKVVEESIYVNDCFDLPVAFITFQNYSELKVLVEKSSITLVESELYTKALGFEWNSNYRMLYHLITSVIENSCQTFLSYLIYWVGLPTPVSKSYYNGIEDSVEWYIWCLPLYKQNVWSKQSDNSPQRLKLVYASECNTEQNE